MSLLPFSDPLATPPRDEWVAARIVRVGANGRDRYTLHCECEPFPFFWDGEADADGPEGVSSRQLLHQEAPCTHCKCPVYALRRTLHTACPCSSSSESD